ncbi:hypothetical protein Strop_1321 [Salinispora tropica CNB-440]|uniref:Uncharacterized protein n=1 Tax=Salinispora tropica (strain ATCC BAA-916 / DSM 44818 / JCM 13857 / NBRC 105044 / CNB-440) TaxID=369723 RepID=A4X4J1_SALTO|nr:hypothetical protein Strop_1321 [Salinispora tropica CNB-440]
MADPAGPRLTGRRAPGLTGRRAPGLTGRRAPGLTGRRAPGLTGRRAPGLTDRRAPGLADSRPDRRSADRERRRHEEHQSGGEMGRRRPQPTATIRQRQPAGTQPVQADGEDRHPADEEHPGQYVRRRQLPGQPVQQHPQCRHLEGQHQDSEDHHQRGSACPIDAVARRRRRRRRGRQITARPDRRHRSGRQLQRVDRLAGGAVRLHDRVSAQRARLPRLRDRAGPTERVRAGGRELVTRLPRAPPRPVSDGLAGDLRVSTGPPRAARPVALGLRPGVAVRTRGAEASGVLLADPERTGVLRAAEPSPPVAKVPVPAVPATLLGAPKVPLAVAALTPPGRLPIAPLPVAGVPTRLLIFGETPSSVHVGTVCDRLRGRHSPGSRPRPAPAQPTLVIQAPLSVLGEVVRSNDRVRSIARRQLDRPFVHRRHRRPQVRTARTTTRS